MPFAAGLRQSLHIRGRQLVSEFTRGDSLEDVLDRHLLAVEATAETEIITSILLLSPDGRRLSHGAAPNLPRSYRSAIDGFEIGPSVGSCGTAAYLGRPVYVTDIAIDPLWANYRHLALPYGLRSCWSTPIQDGEGRVIGTFAIYHRTTGGPTRDELDAIDLIAGHVAEAIMRARDANARDLKKPQLRLVPSDPFSDSSDDPSHRLLKKIVRLEIILADLERRTVGNSRGEMEVLTEDCRRLTEVLRAHLELLRQFTS